MKHAAADGYVYSITTEDLYADEKQGGGEVMTKFTEGASCLRGRTWRI